MSQVLMITSGVVDPTRAEEFQVAFRTLVSDRMPHAPFVRQAMLAHHGGGHWSVYVLEDSEVALRTKPQRDVPTPVQVFRDFGVEPAVEVADISVVFTQAAAQTEAGRAP
jgi:hypothetical protein